MNKLNLPIIKGNIPSAKYLSMDDYLKFVSLNLKYAVSDKALSRARRNKTFADIPFILTPSRIP